MRTRNPRQDKIVHVSMTVAAAERFSQALSYADAVVASMADAAKAPETRERIMEHGDWLRWGMGRIAQSTIKPDA